MKLAEALSLRADAVRKIEQLRTRIVRAMPATRRAKNQPRMLLRCSPKSTASSTSTKSSSSGSTVRTPPRRSARTAP